MELMTLQLNLVFSVLSVTPWLEKEAGSGLACDG